LIHEIKEHKMNPANEGEHVALLSLMMVGVLTKRLDEIGQLDLHTAKLLHQLVDGVRKHAKHRGLSDLNILFDNIDKTLTARIAEETPR
jgi:hypothetical protein